LVGKLVWVLVISFCKIFILSYIYGALLCWNWPFLPHNHVTLRITLISAVFRSVGWNLQFVFIKYCRIIKEPSALDQRTIDCGYPKNLKESLVFTKELERISSHEYLKNFKESLIFIKEPNKNRWFYGQFLTVSDCQRTAVIYQYWFFW
jgi:hypothetical protein